MALIIKLNRPFGVVRFSMAVPAADFGRKGNNAVEVPDSLADALEGSLVPQYRKVILPRVVEEPEPAPEPEPVVIAIPKPSRRSRKKGR